MEQVPGRRVYMWNGCFVGLKGLWWTYLFLGWDRVEMLYHTYLLLYQIKTLSVGFEMLGGAVSL